MDGQGIKHTNSGYEMAQCLLVRPLVCIKEITNRDLWD